MGVSLVGPGCKPELSRVPISMIGVEFSEAVRGIRPRAHQGTKPKRLRGKVRKDIKGVSGNSVGEVQDHSNAVPGIRSLVGRCVSRWSSKRKSRGRIRM
jgi:hypothetical protein